jgi:hypothetical protein
MWFCVYTLTTGAYGGPASRTRSFYATEQIRLAAPALRRAYVCFGGERDLVRCPVVPSRLSVGGECKVRGSFEGQLPIPATENNGSRTLRTSITGRVMAGGRALTPKTTFQLGGRNVGMNPARTFTNFRSALGTAIWKCSSVTIPSAKHAVPALRSR